ncbi:MAG: ATP-binding cassette domain-containing protein [Chloroflexi bacterium]|nr:ATP-binding cassette domain-containing protein [Chloroflexota bacterium]
MALFVDLRGVTFAYAGQPPVLCEIDLRIGSGETVVLAGASGSGKSTLCRLLTGLVPHLHTGELRGQVHVAGLDVATNSPARLSRDVALVLQNPAAQCVATTVERDLALGPAYQGRDRTCIRARVAEATAALRIAHLLERSPHQLSGGEQQRVALAGALAQGGQLLVLDEPFAFLDSAGVVALQTILRQLRQRGITLVIAEHRLDLALPLADRLVVLDRGRIVGDAHPDSLSAAALIGWGLEPPVGEPGSAPPAGAPPVMATQDAAIAADRPAIVEWNGVWFARGERPVLCGATLHLQAGQIVALVGPNGAGKSTLLRHANGLLRPQRGHIRVAGQPAGRRPVAELARDVGLVWQQPLQMLFAPTVREELGAGPRALGRDDPVLRAALCERFGLGPLLDRVPQRLSAGERRRVALVAILASRPRALLLDEPTAGQDAAGRQALADLVVASARDGLAIVVASHDARWTARVASRTVRLIDGRIEAAA